VISTKRSESMWYSPRM